MALRISTGILKGREVWTAKGIKFRPSTQFVRQRVFSIIGFERLRNSVFLDVFAGSGIVGFEALSRGAKKAIFLEISYKNTEMIKKNAERFGVKKRAIVLRIDATRKLRRLESALEPAETINFVFVDPPFDRPLEKEFLENALSYPQFFHQDCAIFLETRFVPQNIPSGFVVVDQRKTGSSVLTTLKFE